MEWAKRLDRLFAAFPDEVPFLRAIAEARMDEAPRLVYLDWLLDRDDPKGELFRAIRVLRLSTHKKRQERRAVQRAFSVVRKVSEIDTWIELVCFL